QFDRGFLSPYMVTDSETMISELDNPYILITDKKLSNIQDLVPLLEQVVQSLRQIFIFADYVDEDSITNLLLNKIREKFNVIAVKAPGFGDRRKAMLEDIAILTGGQVITDELGLDLKDATLDQLGSASKVHVTKDDTTIVEGSGDKEVISGRVGQ